MAFVALFAGLTLLIANAGVQQGTGLIVATLAAGAGWLIRDVIEGERTLHTICQAYAALIELHRDEIGNALSDEEIERFKVLAPLIAAGDQAESVGARAQDPFASLPDIRQHLHLLSTDTVRYLWKWRSQGMDLFLIYDQLGTKAWSAAGAERLEEQCTWIKTYREEYRGTAGLALRSLNRDAPHLKIGAHS
jgi:hypothetical protein